MRGCRPCQTRQYNCGAEYHHDTSPFQMQQRKYRQHDGHGDQRRPRHDDERHISDEAQRDCAQQQRLHDSIRAQ